MFQEKMFIGLKRGKYICGFKNIDYFWRELFEDIAPQITEIRTVAKLLPQLLKKSVNHLFINRLNQAEKT